METYETVPVIQLRSRTLSTVHNVLQLITVLYVVIYIFWLEHGYQVEETGLGSVSVKVKGAGHTMFDATSAETGPIGRMRVQDAVDLVYPPKEENALFLTTNYIDVPRQGRGHCPSRLKEDSCNDFRDCPAAAEPSKSLAGYSTGNCVVIPGSSGRRKGCEVVGWCPTESDNGTTPELNVLAEVETFLIFARASIAFPRAGITTSNLYNASSAHKEHAEATTPTPGLNLFSVRDILAETNTSFDDVAVNGAIFSISFAWDCNLDRDVRECIPDITISRIDDYHHSLSRGYNFRFATYYEDANGTEIRYLRKAYGLRMLVQSSGRGRSFDWATLFVTLGSAMALLGVATVVVDNLALYVLPERHLYQQIMRIPRDEEEERRQLAAKEQKKAAGALKGYGTADKAAPMAASTDGPAI